MSARYLPPDLYRRARQVLPTDLSPHLRGQILDLVETAFGWGYMEGHDRGAEEAWAPVPLLNGADRVGTAQVRANGRAPHPSAQGPAHAQDRDPATVTPLRMGQIAEGIALDRLSTDQLDQVEQARHQAALAQHGPE